MTRVVNRRRSNRAKEAGLIDAIGYEMDGEATAVSHESRHSILSGLIGFLWVLPELPPPKGPLAALLQAAPAEGGPAAAIRYDGPELLSKMALKRAFPNRSPFFLFITQNSNLRYQPCCFV